ncbi:MAG: hypothetical protein OHK93_003810 [Ramalina farinacea]|uniref:Uncharacterized protein n=1 Tax=Ramalina farinacea TaxID=258253 RepID=A0AA43QIP2_9LECA|nr:hypothetical protein [Ramalina farinacea]
MRFPVPSALAVGILTICPYVLSAAVYPNVPAVYTNGQFIKVPRIAPNRTTPYYIKPTIPENSVYFIHNETIHSFDEAPAVYSVRNDDIPFGLLSKGNLMIRNDHPPEQYKDQNQQANDTACGIPGSAYQHDKVAIHPWWLKFAPAPPPDNQFTQLGRYCMPDVCISVWNETGFAGGLTDVIVKVTDICSTDPADANYCASPADILMERGKVNQLYTGTPTRDVEAIGHGTKYTRPVWWYFTRCFQDAITNKGYNHTDNWWANPGYPNNWAEWGVNSTSVQWQRNQNAYGARALPKYPNGNLPANEAKREAARFHLEDHWKEGDEMPEWCPVAGGSSYLGKPAANCGPGTSTKWHL